MTDGMTDGEVTVQRGVLLALATVLVAAESQPLEVDHRTVGQVAQVLTIIATPEDEDDDGEGSGVPPQVPRRRLRLIYGGLGALGAAAVAVGHRVFGQPAAAVVAAGAVAMAGTAAAVVYLGGPGGGQEAAGGPQRAPMYAAPTPEPSSAPTASDGPSAPQTPARPPHPGHDTTTPRAHTARPTAPPTGPTAVTIPPVRTSLPPAAPSGPPTAPTATIPPTPTPTPTGTDTPPPTGTHLIVLRLGPIGRITVG